MFKFSEIYEIDISILECDYIRYSPASINRIDTASNKISIDIQRADCVISLKDSYLK